MGGRSFDVVEIRRQMQEENYSYQQDVNTMSPSSWKNVNSKLTVSPERRMRRTAHTMIKGQQERGPTKHNQTVSSQERKYPRIELK
jgi:proline racemase